VPRNYGEAAKWYRAAADQGWPEAQTLLGMMYAKGQGVAQNDAEAANWFHKAADQGLAEAQTILGAVYVKGQGVAQNYVLAHMWFNLAAAQGDAGALANRGHLARMMTPAQIAEGQHLAQEWKPTK
jgi:TPR repeat protein